MCHYTQRIEKLCNSTTLSFDTIFVRAINRAVGLQWHHVPQGVHVCFKRAVGQDDVVGHRARMQMSKVVLPVGGVSRPPGVGQEDGLSREPVCAVVDLLVARAARERRADAMPRVGVIDGKVAASGDGFGQIAPAIQPPSLLGGQVLVHPWHVAVEVDRLDARQDVQIVHARDVLVGEHLCVFEPRASALARWGVNGGVGVDDGGGRRVADGVDGDLPPGFQQRLDACLECGGVRDRLAAMPLGV